MQIIEVTGLSDAEIAEDFSFSEVTLATRDGSSLRCRFQPKSLDMIVAQLAQIMTHIRNNTASTDGYTTPPVTLAFGVNCGRPSRRHSRGDIHHGRERRYVPFRHGRGNRARLRSEIEAAETSVREHPTQTRQ